MRCARREILTFCVSFVIGARIRLRRAVSHLGKQYQQNNKNNDTRSGSFSLNTLPKSLRSFKKGVSVHTLDSLLIPKTSKGSVLNAIPAPTQSADELTDEIKQEIGNNEYLIPQHELEFTKVLGSGL